jgi:hypothetical protein
MKNLFCLLFLAISMSANAQVAINSDGSLPDNSAMLDVKSENKGVLIPRLSFEQRNAIVTPAEGLMVFCTDCGINGALSLYSNGEWRTFSPCNSIAPAEGTHSASPNQVIWNWDIAAYASGYKWNIVNDYSNATDLGIATSETETGLDCNTSYSRYVWAYYDCGTSKPTTLVQSTLPFPDPPLEDIHIPAAFQITWNWNTSVDATGYKWNTTDDFSTAADLGMVLSMTEEGLDCNTSYTSYVWAYGACGNSTTTALTQSTSGCPVMPEVSTDAVTAIDQTTATSGGNVISDGGATVTEYGVCWSISANPTISDSHTSDGSGTGSFISSLTGLSENTFYYVRAFATNSVGTAYGNEESFTTSFAAYSVRVLVAGGGGGGSPSFNSFPGSSAGGGGGAGGYNQNLSYSIPDITPVTVTVGIGGSGAYPNPTNGYYSSFGTIFSCAGICANNYNGANACTGASGGPGEFWGAGGGGGGYLGPGTGNSGNNGGYGGPGIYNDISGSSLPYCGGGGGGGSAGGSQGLRVSTYGGGGNGSYNNGGSSGGYGQNGIVIVRYTSATQRGTGGVVTTDGGDYIHTFTSSGVFTPF